MSGKISSDQIEALKLHLGKGTAVICPEDQGYEEGLKRWSDIASRPAGVVLLPDNADDIARAVRFAKDNHLDLAVKCGGHSTDSSSSSDGGVSINFARLNKVRVDPLAKTVTVQGGALWEDVNNAAAQFNLAVVGGTGSHIGVGGLTLRGGNGFLTPQYGMVIDSLLSAQVVVADGRQLTASEKVNPDLFWALRGAGQCVGLAVEFTFKAHPQENNVWAGIVTFPGDKLASVVEMLDIVSKHPEGKAALLCAIAICPISHEPVVNIIVFFNGSESAGQRHFAPLLDLGYIAFDVSMKPYRDVPAMLNAAAPEGGHELKRKIEIEPEMGKSSIQMDCIDLSAAVKVPIASTAFPSRHLLVNAALVLQWTDENKDAEMIKWASEVKEMFDIELKRENHETSSLVSNFVSYTQETKVSPGEMFGINAEKLLETKKQYDPENVFRKLNPLF
ncbi:FAD binding domain protein [Aspergillus affinis]|uniref:FAD binding domain protein n=1 Tax=Aspergillus affinis TaxID=1070780 RepID=UPI0022FEA605|nr:FAD binding domain protein [Aspergillus affinis]KAI9041856.1 FAD binding domain protein [Aspergillus affinis]